METCRDTGNNDNARSCPYGSDNTTEAGCSRIDGNNERENGDSRFPASEKPSNKTVLGKSFLEPRLLCHDGRDRRRKDTEVRKVSGRRRAAQRRPRTTRRPLLEANIQATAFGGGC